MTNNKKYNRYLLLEGTFTNFQRVFNLFSFQNLYFVLIYFSSNFDFFHFNYFQQFDIITKLVLENFQFLKKKSSKNLSKAELSYFNLIKFFLKDRQKLLFEIQRRVKVQCT